MLTTTKSRVGAAALGGATILAGLAAFNDWSAHKAEQKRSGQGKFVEIDGVRLHYVERGSGPAVVLLHGNGTGGSDFEISPLSDLLAADHRVIIFDRPGFDLSERPRPRLWTPGAQAKILARAMAELGLERPVLVGHSLGATVAIALAVRHPKAIDGLVLLSGYFYPTFRADSLLVGVNALPLLGDLLRNTVTPLWMRLTAPLLGKQIFAPQAVPARFKEQFPLDLAVRPIQIRAMSADGIYMMASVARMKRRYRRLAMPVAIFTGDQDHIVDHEKQSVRLARDIPGSHFYMLPGLGHMIHHFAHHEIAAAIRDLAPAKGRVAAFRSPAQRRPMARAV